MLGKIKKICMPMLIAFALLFLSANYAFAAGDGTRNNSGTSYTMWVGPGAVVTYSFWADGDSYKGTKENKVQYSDPRVARDECVFALRHGQSVYHKKNNIGSSTAYHRGKVQNGYCYISV